MSSSMVKGYAAGSVGKPLDLIAYDPPEVKEHDVRLSVTHCGLCYTDIHAIDDYYGITDFPFVPGHEIVGRISEIGSAVTGLKLGDRVGVGWQGRSCGRCEWCGKDEEQLCIGIVDDGTWVPYGGFATSVVVDGRFAYKLPDGMPPEVAAVLMCGGISVYNPLKRFADRGTKDIGIVGIGGLGHLAIIFAHAIGLNVTAMSSSREKKDQAIALGADRFVSFDDKEGLIKLEFGLDMILCTSHGDVPWVDVIDTLKKRGALVLVGFADVSFNSTDFVAHEIVMEGSFIGNRATMKEMLEFALKHRITPMIELMPMSRINEAIRRVKENKARYRIVLENDIE